MQYIIKVTNHRSYQIIISVSIKKRSNIDSHSSHLSKNQGIMIEATEKN